MVTTGNIQYLDDRTALLAPMFQVPFGLGPPQGPCLLLPRGETLMGTILTQEVFLDVQKLDTVRMCTTFMYCRWVLPLCKALFPFTPLTYLSRSFVVQQSLWDQFPCIVLEHLDTSPKRPLHSATVAPTV